MKKYMAIILTALSLTLISSASFADCCWRSCDTCGVCNVNYNCCGYYDYGYCGSCGYDGFFGWYVY